MGLADYTDFVWIGVRNTGFELVGLYRCPLVHFTNDMSSGTLTTKSQLLMAETTHQKIFKQSVIDVMSPKASVGLLGNRRLGDLLGKSKCMNSRTIRRPPAQSQRALPQNTGRRSAQARAAHIL